MKLEDNMNRGQWGRPSLENNGGVNEYKLKHMFAIFKLQQLLV